MGTLTRTYTGTRRRNNNAPVVFSDQEKRILCHVLHEALENPHMFGADHRDVDRQTANFFYEAARKLISKLGGKMPPPVRDETLVHYVVVYSKRIGRTIVERLCDDWAEAMRERARAEANPTWCDRASFLVHCFSGSSREELIANHPQYFEPR